MSMFKRKKETVQGLIGLDIGASGMKLVELVRKEKKATLSTHAIASLKPGVEEGTAHDIFQDTKQAGQVLKSLLKKAGVQQRRVNIAIPSHVVFHAMITLPVPEKANVDLRPQVEARVKPLLPLPIEEMVIDSVVVDKHLLPKPSILPTKKGKKKKGEESEVDIHSEAIAQFVELESGDMQMSDNKPKFIRVLVSGSPKTLVDQYVEISKHAGLELVALETESFALIRSLIGNDMSKIMIVDIGEERTNISIVQQGLPFLHRSVKVGGSTLTSAFVKHMNVDMDTAEQMKRDLSYDAGEEPPKIISDALAPMIHEIRYSLKLFADQEFHAQTHVDKIILTGGSAHLPYLDPIITEELKVNVYVGNPWARVMTPPNLKPALDSVAPQLAVAIGLAMKGKDA